MTRDEYFNRIAGEFNPDLVHIDQEAIARLQISREHASLAAPSFPFGYIFPPEAGSTRAARDVLHYLLAQTALQYRFWEGEGESFRRYEFEGAVGSTGMMRAFDRAWGRGLQPSAELLQAIESVDGVREVFRAIPDPASRQRILTETFSPAAYVLCEQILESILSEGKVTIAQAETIATSLPQAYGDPFLKKAMLFLGFAASWLRGGMEVGDELAAYADYQVPNVLRHFGVLVYSPQLADTVGSRLLLAKDGKEERAIRAATVLACEEIARTFGITSAEVDWWCFAQRKAPTLPFHLCETTCY